MFRIYPKFEIELRDKVEAAKVRRGAVYAWRHREPRAFASTTAHAHCFCSLLLQKKVGSETAGFHLLQPLLHLMPFLAAVRAAPRPEGGGGVRGWPATNPSPEDFLRQRLERVNMDAARGVSYEAPPGEVQSCPPLPEVSWNSAAFRLSIPKQAFVSPMRRLARQVATQVVGVIRRLQAAPPFVQVSQAVVVGGPCGGPVFRDDVRARIEHSSSGNSGKQKRRGGAAAVGALAGLAPPASAAAASASSGPASASAAAAPAALADGGGGLTVRVPSDGSSYVAAGAALYLALGNTDKRLQWCV